MSDLTALTTAFPPGADRLRSPQSAAAIRRAVEAAGWRFFHLDGQAIHDKASFLAAAARIMEFPGYVSANWDAFEEAVRDLAWVRAPGYLLLFDSAAGLTCGDVAAWATARSILEGAAKLWWLEGVPMYVLVREEHAEDSAD